MRAHRPKLRRGSPRAIAAAPKTGDRWQGLSPIQSQRCLPHFIADTTGYRKGAAMILQDLSMCLGALAAATYQASLGAQSGSVQDRSSAAPASIQMIREW